MAPQKPLTEDQKQRALEAQKKATKIQGPLTVNQVYQTNQSPIPTRWWYPFNKMNRSFMMDKKATFEEKYWVYNNQQQWTDVDLWATPIIDEDDLVVPPSLEEDPNQSSPLPPDVEDASKVDSLDEFIKQAEIMQQQAKENQEIWPSETPILIAQSVKLWAATLKIKEEEFRQLTVRQLKEEYKKRWWTRDVEMNNNKKSLVNLILELIKNGAQQEETATEWQDGSVD